MGLGACANFQTIERSTTLPAAQEAHGVAIHLDAQQRLVLVNAMGEFCAEPSPDALAAYASALSLGVSVPTQGAGSLAQALQSSAGSIGLRTQSITLMRDALYRMCEAYSNGALGPIQVATLLGRSQDLTAVILAVEQLTGAVAANQVILTGTAGAGASASLLSNQQLLDAARKDEEAKTKSLEEATKRRDAAKRAVGDKREEVRAADAAYKQATAPTSTAPEADRTRLKATLDSKNRELAQLESTLEAAERQVETKEELLDESRRTRETVENLKDSALTNAVANTTGAGQFSTPLPRKELSIEATEAIAKAVQGMVEKVLAKEYTQDSCMALLTHVPKDFGKWTTDQRTGFERVRDLCMQLVSKSLFEAITKTEATFAPDATTERIQKALDSDLTLRRRLNEWLERNGLRISTTLLLYGKEYAPLRQRAIQELSIP
jgi:hypothetical protein